MKHAYCINALMPCVYSSIHIGYGGGATTAKCVAFTVVLPPSYMLNTALSPFKWLLAFLIRRYSHQWALNEMQIHRTLFACNLECSLRSAWASNSQFCRNDVLHSNANNAITSDDREQWHFVWDNFAHNSCESRGYCHWFVHSAANGYNSECKTKDISELCAAQWFNWRILLYLLKELKIKSRTTE